MVRYSRTNWARIKGRASSQIVVPSTSRKQIKRMSVLRLVILSGAGLAVEAEVVSTGLD